MIGFGLIIFVGIMAYVITDAFKNNKYDNLLKKTREQFNKDLETIVEMQNISDKMINSNFQAIKDLQTRLRDLEEYVYKSLRKHEKEIKEEIEKLNNKIDQYDFNKKDNEGYKDLPKE